MTVKKGLPLHSLVVPGILMVGFYGALLAVTPSDQRVSVVGVLIIGAAHLIMVWLVFRDGAGRMKMLYDGLPDVEQRLSRLEQIPAIRRALVEQRRVELGGMDTPNPVVETKFNP